MYVVMGATGNTGGTIAEALLAKGQKIRVVSRDARRLQPIAKKGAEIAVADATDAAALTKAFSGTDAAYILLPPNVTSGDVHAYQQRVGDAIVAALEKNGVAHAVLLSSVGAEKAEKTGLVLGLHRLEQKLGAIARLNVLRLRCGYFMENLLPQTTAIRRMGSMAGPLRADLPLPMIATRDIGAAAADALSRRDFQGNVTRELLGPRDRTYAEATKTIGIAIGEQNLEYKQLAPAALKPVLVQMGMSANFVDLLLEMAEALNSGYMKPVEARSEANSTPTTLEAFVANTFVPAYRALAATA